MFSKSFLVYFQGTSEFSINGPSGHVGVVAVSRFKAPRWYRPAVWESDIWPTIGTVRFTGARRGDPVPAEIVALFPGYVGAVWVDGVWRYDGAPPVVVPCRNYPGAFESEAGGAADRAAGAALRASYQAAREGGAA